MDSKAFAEQFDVTANGFYWVTLFFGEHEITHLMWIDEVTPELISGSASGFDRVTVLRQKLIKVTSVRAAAHDRAVFGGNGERHVDLNEVSYDDLHHSARPVHGADYDHHAFRPSLGDTEPPF